MKFTPKQATVVNFCLSGFSWLLGGLSFLFNLVGLWVHWHLVGFGFIIIFPLVIIVNLFSTLQSWGGGSKKLLILNIICFLISIVIGASTLVFAMGWMH